MSNQLTDATIERETLTTPTTKQRERNATVRYLWHKGFAHKLYTGENAYKEAIAHKQSQKGGEVTRIARLDGIPPAVTVAVWESLAHRHGTKADFVSTFAFTAFDPAKLRERVNACYQAVNKVLPTKDRFSGMAKLLDGGTVKGMGIVGELNVAELNAACNAATDAATDDTK